MKVISTFPPYAPFLEELLEHPVISGIRINTVMPLKETPEDMLKRIKKAAGEKELWIDLKCRQVRTTHGSAFYATPPKPSEPRVYRINGTDYVLDSSNPRAHGEVVTPPWASLKLTHKISLDFSGGPVTCYFQDGLNQAKIVEVIDGDTLIMLEGPRRLVGGGEAINIPDPSLKIEGFFTESDLAYIEAAKASGLHHYMLSYVEEDSDIEQMLELDPDAKIVAKIESQKGLQWAKESYSCYQEKVRLMAPRGDLYTEVGRPDKIIGAMKTIIGADPSAFIASRILMSLLQSARPSCSDITDVACMLQMGYQTLMIGDDICFEEERLLLALDILNSIAEEF